MSFSSSPLLQQQQQQQQQLAHLANLARCHNQQEQHLRHLQQRASISSRRGSLGLAATIQSLLNDISSVLPPPQQQQQVYTAADCVRLLLPELDGTIAMTLDST